MNTMEAFAMGEIHRNSEIKVFDWDKAATLIKVEKPKVASAGLSEDWRWTGGDIYRDGKIIPQKDTYTYLASTWATPVLEMDGETQDCFKMQHEVPDWDSGTYWPKSARNILKS